MKTVLILDDDVVVLTLMRLVVRSKGYTVLEATSAQQAIERFERAGTQVHLLIADLTLPVSSGTSVARTLHSQMPDLKIILTSGYPPDSWDDHMLAELKHLPADSFVTLAKPFLPMRLSDIVNGLIGSSLLSESCLQIPTS